MIRKTVVAVLAVTLAVVVAHADNLLVGSGNLDSGRFTFERRSDTGALVLTGNLDTSRSGHSAVKLTNGSIMLLGDFNDSTNIEVIDQSGNVLFRNSTQDQRVSAAATLLTNGNVFICSGTNTPSAWEIHSPTGALVGSGSLFDSRGSGTAAVTLVNGNVWISGGSAASATDVDIIGPF